MNQIITLQRNMDDGFGTIYCTQKQDFNLNEIHQYFQIEDSFDDIESLVTFLEEKLEEDDYDFLNDIMSNLDESEYSEQFNEIANPNGYGNDVDCLIVTNNGEVIFEN